MSKNDVKRNSWILVRAYDKPVKTNHTGTRWREKNRLANKNVKKTVSDKSGYIIWKDRKVVVIYTNDLLKKKKKLQFRWTGMQIDVILIIITFTKWSGMLIRLSVEYIYKRVQIIISIHEMMIHTDWHHFNYYWKTTNYISFMKYELLSRKNREDILV